MSSSNPSTPSNDDTPVEFYVPATFQFSPEPGRIERIIVGLFPERGALEARVVTDEPTREFYTPAMYQFSTDPGRIERFLDAVFAERGDQEFTAVPQQFKDVFYLPASNPDAFRRRDSQDHVPLKPATDVLPEDAQPPNPSN